MIGDNKLDQSYDEFTKTSGKQKSTFVIVEGELENQIRHHQKYLDLT